MSYLGKEGLAMGILLALAAAPTYFHFCLFSFLLLPLFFHAHQLSRGPVLSW